VNDKEAHLIWEAYGETFILAVGHSGPIHERGWIGKDENGLGFFTRNWNQVWRFESKDTARSTFCQHYVTWRIESAMIQTSSGENAGGTIDARVCEWAASVDKP
jgi:hypothetical protein